MDKPQWKKTHEFMEFENTSVRRYRPYIPEGSIVMDSRWVQEKPVPRFDFLAQVEVQYISWTDYEVSENAPNLKQLVRTPASTRSDETVYGFVTGRQQVLSGIYHEGWSHQDYWGEWDSESSSFEQHSRYYLYEVQTDIDNPPIYCLPEDMKLVEIDEKVKDFSDFVKRMKLK